MISINGDKREKKGIEFKNENQIFKVDTVCQFRAGLLHFLKNDEYICDLEQTFKYIGFSWAELNDVGERFYQEDLAIGVFRPLFNIDSER